MSAISDFQDELKEFKSKRALREGATQGFRQTESQFRPFVQGGGQAFQQQLGLSGAAGPEAQAAAFQTFQVSPGQQFLRDRAQKSLLRTQAATGQLGGGRTQQALQEQAIGLAQQDFGNQFSRLGQISQQGGAFTSQLGGLRSGLSQDITGISQFQKQQQQESGGFGVGEAIGLGVSLFSDIRLKTDVQKVGEFKGVNFYNWEWNEKAAELGLKGRDFGVIAQELKKTHPEFVIEGEYMKIDCEFFKTLELN